MRRIYHQITIFVDRESDPESNLGSVRFWLVQSDLKGMIINCTLLPAEKSFIFTTNVVIQTFESWMM